MRRTDWLRQLTRGLLLAIAVCLCGCRDIDALETFFKTGWSRFLDPPSVVRAPEDSPVSPILPEIGVADRTDERLPNSTLPTDEDLVYDDRDYIIGPTDLLLIGILDLFVQGQESQVQRQVSDTGWIDLPLLDQRIKAEGLNEEELKEAIKQAYSRREILPDAVVSVRVIGRQQSRFSVLGQANQGTFILPRPDTRLLDALAISGGIPQTDIDYIYVMRHKKAPARSEAEPLRPPKKAPVTTAPTRPTVPTKEKPVAVPTTALEAAMRELEAGMPEKERTTQPTQPQAPPKRSEVLRLAVTRPPAAAAAPIPLPRFKWVYENGKWVKVDLTNTRPAAPAAVPAKQRTVRTPSKAKASKKPTTRPRPAIAVKEEPKKKARVVAPAKARAETPPAKPGEDFKWAYRNGRWVKLAVSPKPTPTGAPQTRTGPSRSAAAKAVPTAAGPLTGQAKGPKATTRPSLPPQVEAFLPQRLREAPIPITSPLAPAGGRAPAVAPRGTRPRPGSLRRMPVDDPFGWNKVMRSDQVRILAINLNRLKQGDPRMNVVIRNDDIIYIPPIQVGEFYIMGEVLRPGVYSLTGRRVTIKQAVAAAGNLGRNAWPENSYLIRRVGDTQEQIRPVNIEKIIRGEEPDIFLKPEDVIAIGTHFVVPFMQGLRNIVPTFTMSFSYSRNFAPDMEFSQDPGQVTSLRFRRW